MGTIGSPRTSVRNYLYSLRNNTGGKDKGRGKVIPLQARCGPEGSRGIARLFFNLGARWCGQYNAPAALPPGKTRYPLHRRVAERSYHLPCGGSLESLLFLKSHSLCLWESDCRTKRHKHSLSKGPLPLHTRRRVIEAVLNETLGLHNRPEPAVHSVHKLTVPKKNKKKEEKKEKEKKKEKKEKKKGKKKKGRRRKRRRRSILMLSSYLTQILPRKLCVYLCSHTHHIPPLFLCFGHGIFKKKYI